MRSGQLELQIFMDPFQIEKFYVSVFYFLVILYNCVIQPQYVAISGNKQLVEWNIYALIIIMQCRDDSVGTTGVGGGARWHWKLQGCKQVTVGQLKIHWPGELGKTSCRGNKANKQLPSHWTKPSKDLWRTPKGEQNTRDREVNVRKLL